VKAALRLVACAAVPLLMGAAHADDALGTSSAPGAALRAKFAELTRERSQTQFQRPLYIDSSEQANGVTGEIHALVEHPFAATGAALDKPAQWCEILILHLNVKYCHPSADAQGVFLHVVIGKKYDQPMDAAYPVDFAYRVAADSGDYLQVLLTAAHGPLSTSDYRIMLEAAPAEEGRTLIRLSYSYSHGIVARLAMQVYLATIGRYKVGFTVIGHEPDGAPLFIGGMRGVTERNTMRYYLAIEAFLGAMSVLPDARVEKGFRDWFTAIERYPRQLHEMGQAEYLAMKRMEYARQQKPPKVL
jgi:hypothetical protein